MTSAIQILTAFYYNIHVSQTRKSNFGYKHRISLSISLKPLSLSLDELTARNTPLWRKQFSKNFNQVTIIFLFLVFQKNFQCYKYMVLIINDLVLKKISCVILFICCSKILQNFIFELVQVYVKYGKEIPGSHRHAQISDIIIQKVKLLRMKNMSFNFLNSRQFSE